MKSKPPLTLSEMAARAASVAGRLACPKCHCADFRTYKTIRGHVQTFRYKACRLCGHKILTTQNPEQAIRDVETDVAGDDDFGGSIV